MTDSHRDGAPPAAAGSAPTMTVGEVRQAGARYLGDQGVDNARFVIEMLLCEVLGWPRLRLYLDFDRPLGAAERDRLRALVRRAALGEPWQYIVGHTEFYGHRIEVGPGALIPRPETELLVDQCVAWARKEAPGAALRAADVGTGSGCIAIALAHALPGLDVAALDSSPTALAVAAANLAAHRLEGRIRLAAANLLSAVRPGTLDLVIANLPYIAAEEVPRLPRSVREHEPRVALDGGPGGLALIRQLIDQAAAALRPAGWLGLEVGLGQATAVVAELGRGPWVEIASRRDYGGMDRIVAACRAGGTAGRVPEG